MIKILIALSNFYTACQDLKAAENDLCSKDAQDLALAAENDLYSKDAQYLTSAAENDLCSKSTQDLASAAGKILQSIEKSFKGFLLYCVNDGKATFCTP